MIKIISNEFRCYMKQGGLILFNIFEAMDSKE